MTRIRRVMGVEKQVLRPGTGPKPLPGHSVTVHCTGWGKNHDLSQKFCCTKDPGRTPFTFKIGQGSVIKGWDEGVLDMQVGEVARLRLSPDYAYGAFGVPVWEILPNSIVEFEIEVLAAVSTKSASSKSSNIRVEDDDEETKDDLANKIRTAKVIDQSAVKRKKQNDESAETPRRSKRLHKPLANTISAEAILKFQPMIDVSNTASLCILAGDPQNLDIVGPTAVTQEAVLAPYIAPLNVVLAIQETTTQAPEGVAQESDPSKSLSHTPGLTEASASSSPSGENKGDPSKDINPENLAPNSHGTSSKEANEGKNSPEHFELKEQMDLLEMGNLDSEGLTLLDINVQDYSSTIFDDPMGVIDRFLSNVSSLSHSQLSAPRSMVSEAVNSLPAELLSEFQSVAFTDNILETLKQGQDPTIRLQTIKTKIKANKDLFTQGQLDEVENTVKFLNEFLSAYKCLGALQDSKGSIQQDIATSSMKLRQTGVELAHAIESKRSHQSELPLVEFLIKELEDELKKLNTRKEALQSKSSTQDAKIEADMKILEQLMRLILRDKGRLFNAEKEAEDAEGVFNEHEEKYQALRNNGCCTVDGKDLTDQHQEVIDGDIEIFPE